MSDLREHLDSRLDKMEQTHLRIEDKLDRHLERISKAEADLTWIKGSARIVVTAVITIAGSLVAWLLKKGL